MKLNTLYRIIHWQKTFQPNLTQEEWKELYTKLFLEETWEKIKALQEKNLVEYLDWIWDSIWTNALRISFHYSYWETITLLDYIFKELNSEFLKNLTYDFIYYQIIDDILSEIADSNFSKSLELQKEWEKIWKVIKGENYKPPNLQKIIDKYNIKFRC